ncbi:hypothetical protein [Agromyces bauzanensis]|uniref:TfoX N-terminal domain-containing protein n=1 Tax=Agromyces bauzanensis TaxID=1308924 RepID=A0A917PTK3_9MICO|nr:hypothetical protein [Agromyces bauzanensis]GGJ91254.1 hypothetical protein GCM10011372_32220 [Agromyces bauzanensis]
MQVPKPSDAARDLFASVMPDDPRVVVKPMFGNLGAFVNGSVFGGLFGERAGVRAVDEVAALPPKPTAPKSPRLGR